MSLRTLVLAPLLASGLLAAAPAPALEPTVILLSLDGVRHDYLERGPLPAFERLAREGMRAEALVPVFPSSTFPNHVSMATCTHTDRHGIVANRFHDRERGTFDYGNDASWIRTEPLWAAAERQGVRTAVFFWVGSETDWQGVGARYRKAPFDDGVGEGEKVDQILAWLDLPAPERPRLVLSWWHGADGAGHDRGPDAPEVREALREQDAQLGRLLAGLDARDAWSAVTLLVVSDHGMAAATERFDVAAFLAERGVASRVDTSGAFAHVFLEDPGQREAALAALREVDGLSAWAGDALPERLRYGGNPARTGDVLVLASPPRALGPTLTYRGILFQVARLFDRPVGVHGYDPTGLPEMDAIFTGMGRGIAPGTRLGRVSNLDVAPSVASLLGIEPPRDCEGEALPALTAP